MYVATTPSRRRSVVGRHVRLPRPADGRPGFGGSRPTRSSAEELNFSSLMASAGAGGPSLRPGLDPRRRSRLRRRGDRRLGSAPVRPRGLSYNPGTNATGMLLWQLEGTTAVGQSRSYHVYFDKETKGHRTGVVRRSAVGDERRPTRASKRSVSISPTAASGSSTPPREVASRRSSTQRAVTGSTGVPASGSAGDFRGFPNASKPPIKYFHPGRPGTTTTTILHEGPLRVTFESRSNDNSWMAVWHMYPTHVDLEMRRTSSDYWILYEGTPGGEFDSGDFIRRSDGVQVPSNGTFETDLPGEEWMYAADPADGASFFMAKHVDDGSVDSYRQLDGRMTVLGFGRGGASLNSPYLPRRYRRCARRVLGGLVGHRRPQLPLGPGSSAPTRPPTSSSVRASSTGATSVSVL